MSESGVSESGTSESGAGRTAAFFDLDNTLVRGASVYLLAKGLHARGILTTTLILRGLWYHLVYRIAGERARHMDLARESLLSIIAGMTVREVAQATDEIYDELIADRLWPGTVSLAQGHQASAEEVWLVTAAPQEVARVIAERLGFTGALGTRAEQAEGHYTGRLEGRLLHGPDKAAAVADLARERGIDLRRSAAYSDSHNDLPLLKLVGQPFAVNPDRALRSQARRQGWPIRDFRVARRWVGYGVAGAAGGVTTLGVVSMINRLREARR
ncbi:MAG TPA: HAD-IB family hydrolase [Candidatus Avipropionibacterium avicola]|uniref:HAD-IB family hydrolase n=1 Tax=Candidatus Avipropionibacterium avicola TaxID=2840701 RepID=A0A9D1GY22_9ACTN|nr:HAD-IB family hydrolase [Candidatus Avipropionibacterium avicola]